MLYALTHRIASKHAFKKLVKLAEIGDGQLQPSSAVFYYNNGGTAKNKPGMQDDIIRFCQSQDECLRQLLLSLLDTDKKHHFLLVSPNQTLQWCWKVRM